MKNKVLLKTLAGKTGREIISLSGKLAAKSDSTVITPSGEVETILYFTWKELLGHTGFDLQKNFFAAGGNSLKATQLVSRIAGAFPVKITLEDIFYHPTIAELARLIKSHHGDSPDTALVKQVYEGKPPLSFSQESLWLIDRLHGSRHYHLSAVLRFHGKLSGEALQFALQQVINRHQVLRTVIREEEGKPYQWVKNADTWYLHFRQDNSFADAGLLKGHIQETINRPFDLSKDDLVRAELVELSEKEYILIVVIHHIAADGWSLPLFAREMIELYSSYIEQRDPVLPELPVQFIDYAVWQRRFMASNRLESQLAYWSQKLAGSSVLELPTDFKRPAMQGVAGSCSYFAIDPELHEQLRNISQQQSVTLFMTLLAAYYVLLFRYSGQEDICIGCPMGNRHLTETEPLIGFFVNTLVLRMQITGDSRFTDFLQEVKRMSLEAYSFGQIPFEKLVDHVAINRGLNRTPLFQVVFLLQNTPELPEIRLGDVTATLEPITQTAVQFELEFSLRESQDGLLLRVEYSTEIYSGHSIARMAAHYIELLKSVVANPSSTLNEIRMLSELEEKQLLANMQA